VNYPKESIQHSEHGESLKSRSLILAGIRTPDRSARNFRRYVDFTIVILSRLIISAVHAAQAFEARNCHDYPPTAIIFMTVLNRKLYVMAFGLLNMTIYIIL
jgi:hypothetical protein